MATATAKTKARGFDVTCPFCHDEDAIITLDLNNLDECTCTGCEEAFSPQQARELAARQLRKWEAICEWIEKAEGL